MRWLSSHWDLPAAIVLAVLLVVAAFAAPFLGLLIVLFAFVLGIAREIARKRRVRGL